MATASAASWRVLLISALLACPAAGFQPRLHPLANRGLIRTPLAGSSAPIVATEPSEPAPELTTAKVAELVEVSFVTACMDQAKGYVDTLKLFCVAVKAGYEIGATIPALSLALSMCETQTAGRPLMAEEVDLRALWIALVYLTLESVNHPTKHSGPEVGATVPPDQREKFEPFVRSVVSRKQRGFTLQALKLEEILTDAGEGGSASARTPIETAILSQSMRLVFLTLTVLDEELPPPGSKRDPPKPYIPGTGPGR